MEAAKRVRDSIARSPQTCGCYIWKDEAGRMLYLGKARDLRKRLTSYLRPPQNDSIDEAKRLKLLQLTCSIEWIVTQTESEALLLEANLIRQHKPRFNVRLKDDKRYPYLCVSTSETYPQLYMTRRVKKDKNRYFGPYVNSGALRETMGLLHKLFPIRKIRQSLPLNRPKPPCMNYHIKRCLAPCQGNIDPEDYRKIVDEVLLFLEGRADMLEQVIQKRMEDYSQNPGL